MASKKEKNKIESYRKLCKYVQFGGMIFIMGVAMVLLFLTSRNKDNANINSMMYYIMGSIFVLFIFIIFVTGPMVDKLLKKVINESLNGLVTNVKFNKKKGYSKESFNKLHYTSIDFHQYGCSDFYSFDYKGLNIESVTVRAYDELKVPKSIDKNGKKVKAHKENRNYFFGRIYIIPCTINAKLNIYGKSHPSISRKKDLVNSDYNSEIALKVKKQAENFEVFSKASEKPEIDIQSLVDKLLTLKLQAKGPVSAFIRPNSMILCIDNNHHYKEIDIKNKIDESLIRDYRKDISMVLSFIDSLSK